MYTIIVRDVNMIWISLPGAVQLIGSSVLPEPNASPDSTVGISVEHAHRVVKIHMGCQHRLGTIGRQQT